MAVAGRVHRRAGCLLLMFWVVVFSDPIPARAVTPQQVDTALNKGKAFLYATIHGDNWEFAERRDDRKAPASIFGGQWGGPTAIAIYALLASGEDPLDPRLAPAIKWLKKADIIGTYALSMRCQVWLLLPRTAETRQLARVDRDRLSHSFNTTGRGKFLYTYRTTKHEPNMVDHSVSQFGVLSMWACAQMGIEIPTTYWNDVDARWCYDQQSDGGWLYADEPAPPDHPGTQASMTAAGVATLFITQDYVNPAAGIRCVGNLKNDHIEKGLQWMANHVDEWAPDRAWGEFWLPGYTLYGVERIGVASGLKYFGDVDWYQHGAEWCVTHQDASGAFGAANNIPNTAFCMLFLARGRAPVLINKIEYFNTEGPDAGKVGRWNQRPRDVANFVRWMGRQTERDINWQVTKLQVSEEELHDAPFLYISGNQRISLAAEETEKLRQFILHGGMILFNSDCGTAAGAAGNPFVASVIRLGKRMFPDSEFRDIPPEHPIFRNEQYPPSRWKQKVVLKGLDNGVRELMILMPNDPAKAWQLQETTGDGRVEAYEATDDIILYGTDKQKLHVKGQSFLVQPDPSVTATVTVKIGRVKYNGNWDPEPGGWDRMAAVMHNLAKVDITVTPVEIGKNLLSGYKMLHVTGTTSFVFTAAQKEQLNQYVHDGGTLVFDAAGGVKGATGGSTDFADSAKKLLNELFPGGLKDEPLPITDLVYTNGFPKVGIQYRRYARTVPDGPRKPQMQAISVEGRNAIYYSAQDLSAGLVGEPVDGIVGYDPDSSTEIMSAIILQAIGK